jgi:hypothetical protein
MKKKHEDQFLINQILKKAIEEKNQFKNKTKKKTKVNLF